MPVYGTPNSIKAAVEPPLPPDWRMLAHTGNRWNGPGQWLADDRLQMLEVLLDEAFVIPGTRIRFGIDGIIGLVPGLGDVLAGVLSLLIPAAAWVRGVPYVTLVRMLTNVCIGLLVGAIPFAGDAFLVYWKANRRNYQLLCRSLVDPHRHTGRDWAFLLALGMAIAAVFSLPILVLGWILVKLLSWTPMH